ncbi:MAG: hypothetical protein CVU54_01930 [Deltaproteobacteria bacterium HGW-Deltaproteobacteria-12]|jgi:hypothetical protein|nr:MAG: hypothetical protein CVU54_01930 [Deltaproteobacteria bacterium HGW-Deltaproteobacteria-12]
MDPNVKDLLVSGPLQNISIAFKNEDYIADRVFPILDGADPKAKITVYNKADWFRDEAGIRAAGTRANRGGYKIDEVSVATKEYAFAKEVTDEDRRFSKLKNAPPLKPDEDAIAFASDKTDLKKEIRVGSLITAGTWVDGAVGGEDAEGLWSPAGATNTFLADITKGKKAIKSSTGKRANVLVIDDATYMALAECEAILDKIKYTQRGVMTKELLAAMLELDEVLVGRAIKNTAKETKTGTEFTGVNIWEVNSGKGMGFLFHRPKTLGLKVATAGLQVRVAYDDGQPRRVTTWREPAEHQDVYEVAEETDIVQVHAALGYLFKDTYAT